MRIAVVAPSPVPFGIGGAENLFWGLQRYLNQETMHQCELIKLPSYEENFWEIVNSYRAFSDLDLSYFDCIISGKYPAWMVRHQHHICYMLHRLRGLYDTYHLFQLAEKCVADDSYTSQLLDWMELQLSESVSEKVLLSEFFEKILSLRSRYSSDSLFQFPGPFARTVIHFLDDIALSPKNICKYASISQTVKRRSGYFPLGQDVSVLHPPSNNEGFHCGEDDYLFTVSRLDNSKRVSLIIDSMKYVESNIPLLIAGTGPDENHLKELSQGDDRIHFLGFIKDREAINLYSNALAVPYVPYEEDYGLVTIEAMMSSKPVLTMRDSGGPNEFVIDGETGFSVEKKVEALAERINYLCAHRNEAREMGEKGRRLVQDISWESVASGLLDREPSAHFGIVNRKRPKVTVCTTFPIYPPRGGGQARVFHLYRYLARWWDIDIISLTGMADTPFTGNIAPGLREIRVPKSKEFEAKEQEISEAIGWIPATDIAMLQLSSLLPEYSKELHISALEADAVVASHPYAINVIQKSMSEKPLWFEAQDVEYDLKSKILGHSKTATELLNEIKGGEERCWRDAAVTYACSSEDLARLKKLYGATTSLLIEVPNGASIEDVQFTTLHDRRENKWIVLKKEDKIALFIGSWHPPNLEAIEHIIGFAESMPEVFFLVIGSSGLAFGGRDLPPNLGLFGMVDDETKNVVLTLADVAINPMTSGSGTNLKMLEYFAAGVPVISTEFGARGLACEHLRELILAEMDSFVQKMREYFVLTETQKEPMITRAYELVMEKYNWESIATRMYEMVSGLM
jgi:glycosyltransferase involved in cell wall biosynthesis